MTNESRIKTGNTELDRVLGGGIVPGAVILLGGEPGIGKSTLMLQLALGLKNFKTLYVSGEESAKQIKMRAERLGEGSSDCLILTETSTQNIFTHIDAVKPNLLVVDSIQTFILKPSTLRRVQFLKLEKPLQNFCVLQKKPLPL